MASGVFRCSRKIKNKNQPIMTAWVATSQVPQKLWPVDCFSFSQVLMPCVVPLAIHPQLQVIFHQQHVMQQGTIYGCFCHRLIGFLPQNIDATGQQKSTSAMMHWGQTAKKCNHATTPALAGWLSKGSGDRPTVAICLRS